MPKPIPSALFQIAMNLRRSAYPLFMALLLVPSAHGQDSVRDLTGAESQNKFLTSNQIDRWLFEGEKGEAIIAHVVSKEFDPVLALARTGTKEEKPLQEVDDPGSESRFAFRLPEQGKFEIRVHAFKLQGGGNYTLRIQRFQPRTLTVGQPFVGALDREGKSHAVFAGIKDRLLVPELKGVPADAWRALDPKGREAKGWGGTISFEENGDGYLIIDGMPNQRYDLIVREASQFDLADRKEQARSLAQGAADVWNIAGKAGDFRVLEVEKKGELRSRLIYAPPEKEEGQRLTRPGDPPEFAFLPVASRSGRLRFAMVLGRTGRYQLQLLAASPASYKVTLDDPSLPIATGGEVAGALPVGGTAFYSFHATPGQLLQAGLTSQSFVPFLRLYDTQGALVAGSSDDSDALVGRVTHMVLNEGIYRLQVSSVGDGGGGDFRQSLKDATVEEVTVGGLGKGTLQPGATDFRAFDGKEGQVVFLNIRSSSFEPTVSVRGPDGVVLAVDDKGSAAAGSLFALKLPKTGRYTIWISSRRGAGDYAVRLIDGD